MINFNYEEKTCIRKDKQQRSYKTTGKRLKASTYFSIKKIDDLISSHIRHSHRYT